MEIDKESYELTTNNYFDKVFDKKQIILGNTLLTEMKHVNGWKLRLGGKYKKTSTFTVDRKGRIFQHFDPKYYSDFIGDKETDKQSITISLENQGWLLKDLLKDKYIDWVGNIYKRNKSVYEKRWRGFVYWDSYTKKQMKSCIFLINYLCENFGIEKKCVGHNTYIDGIDMFEGVTYRSNFQRDYTDLNPSWEFKKFKQLIEN